MSWSLFHFLKLEWRVVCAYRWRFPFIWLVRTNASFYDQCRTKHQCGSLYPAVLLYWRRSQDSQWLSGDLWSQQVGKWLLKFAISMWNQPQSRCGIRNFLVTAFVTSRLSLVCTVKTITLRQYVRVIVDFQWIQIFFVLALGKAWMVKLNHSTELFCKPHCNHTKGTAVPHGLA